MVYLKLFDEILSAVLFECLQRRKELICCHPLVRHNSLAGAVCDRAYFVGSRKSAVIDRACTQAVRRLMMSSSLVNFWPSSNCTVMRFLLSRPVSGFWPSGCAW